MAPLYLFAQLREDDFITLKVNKKHVAPDEFISFYVQPTIPSCTRAAQTVYVELLNSKLKVAARRVLLVKKGAEDFQIPAINFDTGIYIIRAYTKEQALKNPSSIQQLLISVGLNYPSARNDLPQVFIYPQSGQAIENFTNRFAITLFSQEGQPVQTKFWIKNKAAQTIAVTSTDKHGFAFVELPLIKEDTFSLQNQKGQTLYSIYKHPRKFVSDKGFSLAVREIGGNLHVEIRKAENEARRNVKLYAYYSNTDKLLYEASAVFREDTLIVETAFSVKGLEHKLLHVVLKDAEGVVVAKRLVLPVGGEFNTSKSSVDFDQQLSCIVSSFTGFDKWHQLTVKNVNDYLIAATISNYTNFSETPGKGFSLFFFATALANQFVNYQVQDSNGIVVENGNVMADSLGIMELDDLNFKNKASVVFYLKPEQSRATIIEIPFPVEEAVNNTAYELLKKQMRNEAVQQKAAKRIDTSITEKTAFEKKAKELKEVIIQGKAKTRKEELEDKYVSNGFFRSQDEIDIDVENDPHSVQYHIYNYLTKFIPGIQIEKDLQGRPLGFIYRQGRVSVLVNEIPIMLSLPFTDLNDIGYIKFIKGSVIGLNKGGGALQKGQSNISGTTGTLLIYTKKYSEVNKTIPFTVELPVMGYEVNNTSKQ